MTAAGVAFSAKRSATCLHRAAARFAPGEPARQRGGKLAGCIDHNDAGFFQCAALRGIASGVAGDDGAGMAHFLARVATRARRRRRPRASSSRRRIPPRSLPSRRRSRPPTRPHRCVSSLSNAAKASRVVVPIIGSPPMPMKADWPTPARVRLRQTSVPRLPLRETTPTEPGRKMFGLCPGMMPTKPSPGVTSPAVFGPTICVPARRAASSTAITSCAGMCSVSMTRSFTPAAMASSAAALAKRRRNEHDGGIVRRFCHCLGRRSEYRQADMGFAGALRIDAGDDAGAALDHLFGPERALLAGNSGHQHAMGFSMNDHRAASTAACTASSMKS